MTPDHPAVFLFALFTGVACAPPVSVKSADTETTDGVTAKAASPSGEAPARAASLPDFELETIDGNTLTLSQHLGQSVILLDFWATYCQPCLVAMPRLNELYQRHKDAGLLVLGVSVDGPESVAQVRTEVAKLGIQFPILLDQETRVLSLYNPKASVPFSLLIGRDGRVIETHEGYRPEQMQELEAAVARAVE